MSVGTAVSRKKVAFGMRALAAAGVVRDTLWSALSFFDADEEVLTLTAPDGDAAEMSPLDTRKVRCDIRADHGQSMAQTHTSAVLSGDHAALLAELHRRSGATSCCVITNTRASWLAAQPASAFGGALPAYDLNCAMYARAGDVARFDDEGSSSLSACRLAVLPNHAVALFGSSIEQVVMRAIYADLAMRTIHAVHATGGNAVVAEHSIVEAANAEWDANPTFSSCPELKMLRKRMNLPQWWDRVDLTEYNDDDMDELSIVAARPIGAGTPLARVSAS